MKTLLMISFMAAGLHAQNTPSQNNLLTAELKRFYEGSRNNIMRSAEKVPESGYSFKPADGVRTFGELIAHAAEYQMIVCSGVKGEQQANPAAGKTSKEDLIAALKTSSAYCDALYDSLTDAALAQPSKLFGRDVSKQGALYFNVIHNNEDYGTMVPYMRMQKIVPPSSEPRGAAKK